jgi:drug/metabolite transporter (DMT)-like permease
MEAQRTIGAAPRDSAQMTRVRPWPPGFVLLFAVAAMSWAGPLVRFAAAPALAIAAWRLIFSVALVCAILVIHRQGAAPFALSGREWRLALASGALLAAHFWSWIASLELTTVASSVVLVSTQPVFVAVFAALFLRERASRRQWAGILVAVFGAAVVGWGDGLAEGGGGTDGAALGGDLLAIAGAVFAAGYYVIGRSLRRRLDLWVYVGVVYGVAAGLLTLAAIVSPSVELFGHPRGDWWIFLALAVGPMMIGHTGVNYSLRYLPAHVANLAVLGEPVGATLIAWLLPAIGEAPTPQVLAGGALIGAGLTLAAREG